MSKVRTFYMKIREKYHFPSTCKATPASTSTLDKPLPSNYFPSMLSMVISICESPNITTNAHLYNI